MNALLKISSVFLFVLAINAVLLNFTSWAIVVPNEESQGKSAEYLAGYKSGKSNGIDLVQNANLHASISVLVATSLVVILAFSLKKK